MATVYSLICWGGAAGKTPASCSTATDLFTLNLHGLKDGTGIVPQTAFAGLSVGVAYYANTTRVGAGINTFYVYTSKALALIGGSDYVQLGAATTGVFKSEYYLGLGSLSRWVGVYNGQYACNSARNSALVLSPTFNTEVYEIGEAFHDWAGLTQLQNNCSETILTTRVAGSYSPAFHNAEPGSGYVMKINGTTGIQLNQYYCTVDGLELESTTNSCTLITNGALACYIEVKNNLVHGLVGATAQKGIYVASAGDIHHNIIYDIYGTTTNFGLAAVNYGGIGTRTFNNIVTKCGTGIIGEVGSQGEFYNNISVGNTINWKNIPPYGNHKSSNNIGEITDRKEWTVTVATSTTVITVPSLHLRTVAVQPIRFSNVGGSLPVLVSTGLPLGPSTTYYVKTVPTTSTMTISATPNGAVLAFSSDGTGTHYFSTIWFTLGAPLTMATSDFVDWAGNDFRPAADTSPQVNSAFAIAGMSSADIVGAYCPDYESATYPDNLYDAGAVEFQHGDSPDGRPPYYPTITISAQSGVSLSGAEIHIYDMDNTPAGSLGTELVGTGSGVHNLPTFVISTLNQGNTVWIQIMQDGFEEFGVQYTIPSSDALYTAILKAELNT